MNTTNLQGTIISTPIGHRVELFCFVEGFPFPEITWMKDGKTLSTNTSLIQIREINQKLTIREFIEPLAGFYECIAENRGGKIEASVTLNVLNGEYACIVFFFNITVVN